MKKLFALALLASPSVFAAKSMRTPEQSACTQYEAQISVEVRAVTEMPTSCLVEFNLDLNTPGHAFNPSTVCPLLLEDALFTGFLVNRVENTDTMKPNCGINVGDLLGGVLVRKEGDELATLDLGL
jgi:hypothetical protein